MGLLRVLLGLGLLLLLLQKEALKKKTSPLLIIKSISRSTAIVSHHVLLQEERLECCSMINKFKVEFSFVTSCVFSCAFCVYFYLLFLSHNQVRTERRILALHFRSMTHDAVLV